MARSVGRVANRTANSRFELEGKTWELTPSEGRHHLHGGTVGLGNRIWTMETDSGSGRCSSPTRARTARKGYPGAVDFRVTFRLEGPRLICEMAGMPDRPTPINLANHNYYNLGGSGTVKDHLLWVDADGVYADRRRADSDGGDPRRWKGRRSTSRKSGRSATRRIDHNLVLREPSGTRSGRRRGCAARGRA